MGGGHVSSVETADDPRPAQPLSHRSCSLSAAEPSVSDGRLVWNNFAGGTSPPGAVAHIWAILCTMAAVKVKTHEIRPDQSRWWRGKRKLCSLHHLASALGVQNRAACRPRTCVVSRTFSCVIKQQRPGSEDGGKVRYLEPGSLQTSHHFPLGQAENRKVPVCFLPDREEVFDGKNHTCSKRFPLRWLNRMVPALRAAPLIGAFTAPQRVGSTRTCRKGEESPTAALLAQSPAARCHLSSHSGLCSGQYHVFPKNYESGRDNSRLCAACLPLPSHLLVIQPSSCLDVRICLLSLKQKPGWFLVVRTGCKRWGSLRYAALGTKSWTFNARNAKRECTIWVAAGGWSHVVCKLNIISNYNPAIDSNRPVVFKRIYGDIFYIQIFQRCLILACFFVFKPSQTFEELLLCVSAQSISVKVDTGLYSGAVITWVGHDLKPWGFFCFVFFNSFFV